MDIAQNIAGQANNLPVQNAGLDNAAVSEKLNNQNQLLEKILGNKKRFIAANKVNDQGNSISRNIANLTKLGLLFASMPFFAGSVNVQSSSVKDETGKYAESGIFNYLSTFTNVVSTMIKVPVRLFFKKQTVPFGNVTHNKRLKDFDAYKPIDSLKRILSKNVIRRSAEVSFLFRRILPNIFPQLLNTSFEEVRPEGIEVRSGVLKKSASGLLSLSSKLLSPARFFTSLVTSALGIPIATLTSYSAFIGNQKAYDAGKYFYRFTNMLLPIPEAFSELYRSAKAFETSIKNGETLKTSFLRYNVSPLSPLRGLISSVIAIPYSFGVFKKIFNKLEETSTERKEHFKNLFIAVENRLKNTFGISIVKEGNSLTETVENLVNKSEKSLRRVKEFSYNISDKLQNSSKVSKKIFGSFRPTDEDGNVRNSEHIKFDSLDTSGQKIFGFIPKEELFKVIHDIFDPLQHLLMHLPNAAHRISDPFIQDNGKGVLRFADTILGLSSLLLSLPNYITYAFTSRIPQIVIKYHQLKQKAAEEKGEAYDGKAMIDNFASKLESYDIHIMHGLLDELELSRDRLADDDYMESIFNKLEEKARHQEPILKSNDILASARRLMRNLISEGGNNSIFYAHRDADGLTEQEHNRKKFYDSIESFQDKIGRLPVIGQIAGVPIALFKRLYKVESKKGIKLMPRGAKLVEANRAQQQKISQALPAQVTDMKAI